MTKTFVKILGEWEMAFSSLVSVNTTYNIKAVSVEPKHLQAYTGTYQFTKFSADTISVSSNKLYVASTGGPTPQDVFIPVNDSTFSIKEDWARILFSKGRGVKLLNIFICGQTSNERVCQK